METFALPLAEMRERFTWSEQVLMGWRSQEQAVQMRKKFKSPAKGQRYSEERDSGVPEGLPNRFLDESGEINLSKVGLADAVKYMDSLGFHMPMGGGASRS